MAQSKLQNSDKKVMKSGDYVKYAPNSSRAFVYASTGDTTIIGRAAETIYPGKWGMISLTGSDIPATEYADNAAALLGGLLPGDRYRTGDTLKICH